MLGRQLDTIRTSVMELPDISEKAHRNQAHMPETSLYTADEISRIISCNLFESLPLVITQRKYGLPG